MLDFSFGEMAVIGVVALVVIGPERLPKVARTVGKTIGRLQRYVNSVKSDIEREMQLEELRTLQAQVRQQAEDLQTSLREQASSLEAGLRTTAADLSAELQPTLNSDAAKPAPSPTAPTIENTAPAALPDKPPVPLASDKAL